MRAAIFVLTACVVVGIAVGLAASPPAWAGPSTPHEQFRAGVPPEQIECRDGLVLMETNSGKPACVNKTSVERLEHHGWSAIGTAHHDNASRTHAVTASEPGAHAMTIRLQPDAEVLGELGQGVTYWPKYEVTFPETVRVGEKFDVVWDYAYIIPGDDGNYSEFKQKCDWCEMFHAFQIDVPTYVDFEHELSEVFVLNSTDLRYRPVQSTNAYDVRPPFNNTGPLQERFTFTINEPDTSYRYGVIHVTIYGHGNDVIYFAVGLNGTVALSKEYLGNVVEDPGSRSVRGAPNPLGQLVRAPSDLGYITREDYVANGPYDGPDLDFYAEIVRETPNKTGLEQELLSSHIKQSWIDEFFEAYPEFASQRVLASLMDWILPPAYGASSSVQVVGKILNTDPDGRRSPVHDALVCAYDDDNLHVPLRVGTTNACSSTSSSGNFRLNVPARDPTNGNTDLVLKIFAENRYIIIYSSFGLQRTHIETPVMRDISGPMVNFGRVDISSPQYGRVPPEHRSFWALEELTSIVDWYDEELDVPSERLEVVYDPDRCLATGVDPDSKKMTLAHTTYGSRDRPCVHHLISPLSNSDTLAHEYGHFVFLHAYDDMSSAYPPYVLLDSNNNIHSPVHGGHRGTAWIEGWAHFMALAYSGTPTFQPAYMLGQWDFETRTHNELTDPRFVGRPFFDGPGGEGSVAAALWDMIDTTNEGLDNRSGLLEDIWDTMRDTLEPGETIIASDILEFKDDWDDNGNPNIQDIFVHNTLATRSSPRPPPDPAPVPDTEPPVITAPPAASAVANGVLTAVALGDHAVTDNEDPSPTVTNDAPDYFPVGITTVTWTATDESGNSATDTSTVTVAPGDAGSLDWGYYVNEHINMIPTLDASGNAILRGTTFGVGTSYMFKTFDKDDVEGLRISVDMEAQGNHGVPAIGVWVLDGAYEPTRSEFGWHHPTYKGAGALAHYTYGSVPDSFAPDWADSELDEVTIAIGSRKIPDLPSALAVRSVTVHGHSQWTFGDYTVEREARSGTFAYDAPGPESLAAHALPANDTFPEARPLSGPAGGRLVGDGWTYRGTTPAAEFGAVGEGGSPPAAHLVARDIDGVVLMGKTFDVSGVPDGHRLKVSYDYRAKSNTDKAYVTQTRMFLHDADTGELLRQYRPVFGGVRDTGWATHAEDVTAHVEGVDRLRVALGYYDAFTVDFGQRVWYDNFRMWHEPPGS